MRPNISNFHPPVGVDVSLDKREMTYLYGISDFWSYMFEDSSVINTLLESNSIIASDIYSKFLQMSAGISIDKIATSASSQLKLVIISEVVYNAIDAYSYRLPGKVVSARYISNRPFLPTLSLEEGVDYYINETDQTISFAKPLDTYGFPSRTLANGDIETSLWFVDVVYDEDLVYSHFPKLLGLTIPNNSTELYRNFLYGLFFVYTQGPSLSTIRRGLNLCVGIPLARETEVVIDIRKYIDTDQDLVITNLNSYLIPYGLPASVVIGQILNVGDELATWAEIKDYQQDGDWWLNLALPKSMLPYLPPGESNHASAGSYAEYLMANFLKKNTFLVKISTTNFKNQQAFADVSNIIASVKPVYTNSIYIWTVPIAEETFGMEEIILEPAPWMFIKDSITSGINSFKRNSISPLNREAPIFTRFSLSESMNDLYGKSPEVNGLVGTFNGGQLAGYIAPMDRILNVPPAAGQYSDVVDETAIAGSPRTAPESNAAMKMTMTRDQDYFLYPRNQINLFRNHNYQDTVAGTPEFPYRNTFTGYRSVLLYVTLESDVQNKLTTVGGGTLSNDYVSTLFKPATQYAGTYFAIIQSHFNTLFSRGASVKSLGFFAAPDTYNTFTPQLSDVKSGDYLAFVRVVDDLDGLVGVWWVTSNMNVSGVPYYWPVKDNEVVSVQIEGQRSRGLFGMGGPSYTFRGANATMTYSSISGDVGANALNEPLSNSVDLTVTYNDLYNTSHVLNRQGVTTSTYVDAYGVTHNITPQGTAFVSKRILK